MTDVATSLQPDHLVVHVSHRCNLACPYCYDGFGRDASATAPIVVPEDVREAVRSLLDPAAEPIRLGFIGGEPLLQWRRIRESIRLVAADRTVFPTVTLTTNGTPLTAAMIRELSAVRARVLVSIEGTSERHRKLRPPMGERHYARLIEHLRLLVASLGGNVAARMTLWGEPGNFAREVAAVAAAGVHRILVYPDAGIDPETCRSVMEELATAFAGDVIAGRLVLEPLSGRYVCLSGGLAQAGCGAGRSFLVLGADRLIYACHRTVGDRDRAIGSLDGGLDPTSWTRWLDGMAAMHQSCDGCAAAPACRFPCAHPRVPDAGRSGEAWCAWMRAAADAAAAAQTAAATWGR